MSPRLEYVVRVSQPEQWRVVAEDGNIRVTLRRVPEGTDMTVERLTPYGIRSVSDEKDISILLTGEGHAVLTAAVQMAAKFYPHRKVSIK